MSTAPEPDYAHTGTAERNRLAKARTLARWLYEHALTADDLDATDAATRRAWARAAAVLPPSTDETWHAVTTALHALTAWAEANPGHPQAARPHANQRACWLAPEPVDAAAATDRLTAALARPDEAQAVTVAPVITLDRPWQGLADAPDADEPVTPEPAPDEPEDAPVAVAPQDAPRGWAECVQLGPIPRRDARCDCGRRAVTATLNRWRCAEHPPRRGEWGHLLDHTPTDPSGHPEHAHRCYEPRCPHFTLAPRAFDPALAEKARR